MKLEKLPASLSESEATLSPAPEKGAIIDESSALGESIKRALSKFKKVGGIKSSVINLDIENLAKTISDELLSNLEIKITDKKRRGILSRIRGILKRHPSLLAIITALELMFADANWAMARKQGGIAKMDEIEGELSPIHRSVPLPVLGSGSHHIEYRDSESVFILHSNLKRPESLSEVGKMFIEPIDMIISFPYKKENGLVVDTFIHFLFENKPDKEDDEYRIIVEFPYRYSKNYDLAQPEDEKQMLRESILNGETLLYFLKATLGGFPTFFSDEIQKQYGQPTFYNTIKRNIIPVKINELSIKGYASPESENGVNTDSIRNIKLSKIRAQNAAEIIRNIFEKSGFNVDTIKYKGEGEVPLTEKEKKELLEMTGYKVTLDKNGIINDGKIMRIIQQYNNNEISQDELSDKMDQIIGNRRKVVVEMKLNEKKGLIVVPLPLFIILILGLYARRRDERE